MGGPSSDEGSLSSLSSVGGRSRRSGRQRSRSRGGKRRKNEDGASRSMPAAPSDWEQLRAHFQFVLPDDDDGGNSSGQKYGATWQERMVQHYHSHLYKEYVLADLSRVMDLGKVGLRWRTEKEVANGRGFRCCGNLKCEGSANVVAKSTEEREAYNTAARRHMGIAIPENGGKEPMGMVLPSSGDVSVALDAYLQSCASEREKMEEREQSGRHSSHKRKRKHKHRSKDKSKYSPKEQEGNEQKRLARLPHGTGLHDYEVDFAYVEHGTRKRELVKVRLCLRCAPLLFVSKLNEGKNSREEKGAPAVKAREAREKAARNHATMANASDANPTDGTAGGIPESVEERSSDERKESQSKRSRRSDSETDDGRDSRDSEHRRRKHRRSESGKRHTEKKKKRRRSSSSSSDGGSSSSGSFSTSSSDSNCQPKKEQRL